LVANRDGVLEAIVLAEEALQESMLAMLPTLARLCGGTVFFADGEGRYRHRADRDGNLVPLREVHGSGLARAVARTRRPRWEEDESAGELRVAFPVGDWTVEIVGCLRSKSLERAVRLGSVSELVRGLERPAFSGEKDAEAARGCGALGARYRWEDIIGRGPAISRSIARGKAAAHCNAPVLLAGESGTGKELFAQAIHNDSARHRGPFIAINCSALPETLADSTFFGYIDGTFTGASKGGRPGVFEQAHGGTLLLDEITEMSVDLQGKLLRVLQEREVCRIGSVKPIPIDTRIIVTSNRDLQRQMREGRFREDLYYRLNVLDIHLPPLRDRREDIPPIANRLIECLGRAAGRDGCSLHPQSLAWLMEQPWPGNIRELRNALERAVSLAEGDILLPCHLEHPEDLQPQACSGAAEAHPGTQLCQRLAHAEEASIREALRRNGGHRGKTATELGISVTTLWRRMRHFNCAPAAPTWQRP
jgi:sigma-54 dependent transcriptional regulator, acetoin dehydrogenase operon transcriptional activator AcoR